MPKRAAQGGNQTPPGQSVAEKSMKMSCGSDNDGMKWEELGITQLLSSQIQAFETSDFYDCTFRVGSSSAHKDFKCHKAILSGASVVFKAMFSGNFKEAKMGPDEPILLENVDPKVFESAMRFVYGRSMKDLESIALAAHIYKFADEMQIDCLTRVLDKIFKDANASEIFALFDLYKMLNFQKGLESCKRVLEADTAAALASDHWLGLSTDGVEEFLRMEILDVDEMELIRNLVRWGKFQVQKDGHDPKNGLKVRSKILAGLRLIRLTTLKEKEIEDCFQKELSEVLTLEERYFILLALATKNWKLLPSDVCSSETTCRKKHFIECQFTDFVTMDWFDGDSMTMVLQTNKNANLVGLATKGAKYLEPSIFTFELKQHPQNVIVATGSSQQNKFMHQGKEFLSFTPKCILAADTKYKLEFQFNSAFKYFDHPNDFINYSTDAKTSASADWLTVTCLYLKNFADGNGMSLLFTPPP